MSSASKVYLKQDLASKNRGQEFFLITFDGKSNYGYVSKKGRNWWRMYTILGKKLKEISSRKECFSDLKTLEECVTKLSQLAQCEVEILYLEEEKVDNDKELKKVVIEDIQRDSLQELYFSKANVWEQITSSACTLTPGADYKLELFLESLSKKNGDFPFSKEFINGTTYQQILDRHETRITNLS